MANVGVFQAKARLSELIDQVLQGSEVTITRHGNPVARLVAAKAEAEADRSEAAAAMRAFRKGIKVGRIDLKSIIAAGRR